MPTTLPPEIIEQILLHVADNDERDAFRITNNLNKQWRLGYVRKWILINKPWFSIDRACSRGNVTLLDWWITESNLTREQVIKNYSKNAFINAALGNHTISVFEWFHRNKLPVKGENIAALLAMFDKVSELRWMKFHGWNMNFGNTSAKVAYTKGYRDVLKFMIHESGMAFTFTFPAEYYLELAQE